MKLHELSPAEGATGKQKRLGRGIGSGHGKTSGKDADGYFCSRQESVSQYSDPGSQHDGLLLRTCHELK